MAGTQALPGLSILEQDNRFEAYYTMAKKKPRKLAALNALATEDLRTSFRQHCATPIDKAHPIPGARPKVKKIKRTELTEKQKFQLKMMEHRGKIIAVIGGVVTTALLAVIAYIQGVL